MGENAGVEGQPLSSGQGDQSQININPNWNGILSAVPQEHHQSLLPQLQQWDQGVSQKIQSVHSEYEPWKDIIGSGIEPDVAQYGVNLLNAMEENPVQFASLLMQYYNIDPAALSSGQQIQGQQLPGQGQDPQEIDPYRAELDEMRRQQAIVAQYLTTQHERQAEDQEYAQLSHELDTAHTKYKGERGYDFDEGYVLSRMQQGSTVEDAIDSFYAFAESTAQMVRSAVPPAPRLLGSGGSNIFGQKKPGQLSESETRDVTVQLLEALHQGG